MKRNMLLVTLVLAATSSMATRIHLAMVHFRHQNHTNQCGGSIISANLVLTSAHCFYHISHSGQSFEMYLPKEVGVTSGFKRNHQDKFVYSYKFKVSELIRYPEHKIESLNAYNRITFDIGLVRLETPINFGTYQNLNSVKLARPTDQFQADKCVLESWNRPSEQVDRVRVTLQEGVLPGVLTSPLVGFNKDGYPVICLSTGTNSEIQVALVAGNIIQYNTFASVPPSYQWIEAHIVGQSMHQPSGSQMTSALQGELDDPRNHPHLVVVNILRNDKWERCGGSIISANWVLTSAHCLFHPPDSRGSLVLYNSTQVAVSREYKENNEGRFVPKLACEVLELIPHNEYLQHWNDSKRENQSLYDLGLVRLMPNEFANSRENLVKIISPTDDIGSATQCVLAAWKRPVKRPEVDKATLALQFENGIYKSQLDLDKMDGYPVLCPTSNSNSMVQVAVVGSYSMMTSVLSSYQWIQSHLTSIATDSAGHQPSGSAQGHSGHQPSGSSQGHSGHQDTEQTQNNSFYAHLVIVYFKKGDQKKRCGGSLITPQFVLTAAHCFYTDSREMFDAGQTKVVGGFYYSSGLIRYHNRKQAKQFIPHEEYRHDSPERATYDIGLVKFRNVTNYMRPIPLADSVEKLDLSRCLWAGWPYTFYNDIVNQNISLEFSETLSPQIFTSRPEFPFPFKNKQNQGGPVLCLTKSDPKHLEQVAVAIDTNRNGYQYLNVPFHLRWIQSIIGP